MVTFHSKSRSDRFGRVKDSYWYDYGAAKDVDRIKYGYDRASNRIWRENTVATAASKDFDELYDYDLLHRLKDMARGRLDAAHTGLSAKTFAQCWTLDETGNWKRFQEDDTGAGTWSLVQSRTANPVNEITDITESTGPAWVTPAYDPAGNMTTIPKPADPTQGFTAVYDAWNRLVKLSDSSGTVQENQYDGRNFRVVRKDYSAGMLTDTRHFYYTSAWQVLEERADSSANPNLQFAWGLRYIDDYVLRDCDTSGSGTLDARPSGVEARARLYGYHFGRVEVGHMWNAHEVRRARINRNASQPRETDGWPQSHGGCRYALQGIQAVANSVSLDSAER